MKKIRIIFLILLTIILGYLVVGNIILPENVMDTKYVIYKLDTDWYQINSSQSRQKVDLPGKLPASNYCIETTLPDDIDERVTTLAIRTQDARVYLDNELVYDYNSYGTSFFKTSSMLVYLTIPLPKDAGGKVIRVDGYIRNQYFAQPYLCTELSLWNKLVKEHGFELFISFIVVILGLSTVVICIIFEIKLKKYIALTQTGLGVTITALWIAFNSIFRSVFFSNLSIGNDSPILMIMLLPYPLMLSINSMQKRRYEKAYVICACISTFLNLLGFGLYASGTMEFIRAYPYIIASVFLGIIITTGSIIIDIIKGYFKDYYYAGLGFLGFIVSIIIQYVAYFMSTGYVSGIYTAVGLLWFLFSTIKFHFNQLFSLEKEKQAAILANKAKGNFLAQMSHEIRTPINAVLGMNEMILRETKEPSTREYATDIQGAGKGLLSLINDILDISKIESGKLEIQPVEYDFSSLINDTISMIHTISRAKGLELYTDIAPDIPSRLVGDDIRIRQILINLLTNSVKYTATGSVTLKAECQSSDLYTDIIFSVIDTGIGIKEEDIPKLYLNYARFDEEKNRQIEGTGLGMSIVQNLLQLMDSHFDVHSVYGKGTTFTFTLRQEIVDASPIGNLSERIENNRGEYTYSIGFTAEDAKVLVVDDNAVNRKVVRNLLKSTLIQIDEADSGLSCLEKLKENSYDMLLLDHMMPEMDGIETLHEIKKMDNPNTDIPIFVLTANAVTGAKEMYLKEGFTGFLSKPISYDQLEKALMENLPAEKLTAGTQINVAASPNENPNNRELEELLENIPAINLRFAYLNNPNPEDLYEVIVDFINLIDLEADKLLGFTNQLPDSNALREYKIQVHSMKSSAAMIGAVNLSGVAQLLENAAADGNTDSVLSLTPLFLKEWTSYKEKLSPISDRENSLNGESDLPETNLDLIRDQLLLLQDAMAEMDIDRADEIISFLKGIAYPDDLGHKMTRLYAAVLSLDEELTNQIISEI